MDNAMKSRRDGSATALCSFSEPCLSSIVAFSFWQVVQSAISPFNSIFAQNHMSTACFGSSFSFLAMRVHESPLCRCDRLLLPSLNVHAHHKEPQGQRCFPEHAGSHDVGSQIARQRR